MRRSPPAAREEVGGYSYDEVMEEIGLIVADTARFVSEDPTRGMDALGTAEFLAEMRDERRLRAQREVPLGSFASLFAGWLIRRADDGDFAAGVQAAWLAVNGSRERPVLGRELREYVRGCLDGSISGEENTRRQKHPKAKLSTQAAAAPVPDDPVASAAAVALTAAVAEVSGPAAAPDAWAAWEAFKRFAALSFAPDAPERLADGGGDMLLCEYGIYEWPWSSGSREVFLVDLVRQFSVVGEDGEYDRMEHVHCSIAFDPRPALRQLGGDAIWSDTDRCHQWFAEVEQSGAFLALRTAEALNLQVEHSQV